MTEKITQRGSNFICRLSVFCCQSGCFKNGCLLSVMGFQFGCLIENYLLSTMVFFIVGFIMKKLLVETRQVTDKSQRTTQ